MKGHKKLFEEPIFGQNWKEKPLKLNTHGHINLYDLECEITCKRSKIIIDQKLSTHKKVYSSAPHVPDQPESTKKRIIFTQIHRKGKYGPKKLTHVAACISDSSWHVVSKPKSEKTPRDDLSEGEKSQMPLSISKSSLPLVLRHENGVRKWWRFLIFLEYYFLRSWS